MGLTQGNGYLDNTGSSPFGAHADHNHSGDYEPKNAALLKSTKVSIAVADWSEGSASVDFPTGLTTYVGYIVDNGSQSEATTAELVVSTVGTTSITFGVTETPTDTIDIFILYL